MVMRPVIKKSIRNSVLMSGIASLLSACTPSFASQTQVTDLRILGIQAEPPEALFDATCTDPTNVSTCTVSNVDDMQITLLYVDPVHPSTAGVVTPALCAPNSTDPICGAGSLMLQQQQGPQDTLGFSLFGAFTGNDLQQLPGLIVASAEASSLMGYGGIQVELQLGVDTGDPAGVQLGSKTLVFNPRTPDGNPNRNHNPGVSGMKMLDDKGNQLGLLTPGQTLQLTVGTEIGLRPVLTPGSIETYQTVDLTGATVTVRENLQWNFYSTSGSDFDDGTASEPLAGVADPPEGLTRITASKATSGTMWAVVHDGRGGDAWIEFPWQATGAAP